MAERRYPYDPRTGHDERRPEVVSFLNEVAELERKYGLCISHEDSHGAFEVKMYHTDLQDWLLNAFDDVYEEG